VTETWPVEDLLPLSLRATFLSSSSASKQKLLRKRLYAYPAAAFDTLFTLDGDRALLTAVAFTAFERHVKSFAACAARRVKVGLDRCYPHSCVFFIRPSRRFAHSSV
jgi:hypothetical protein